jgi:hypothetical protein
MKLRGNSRNVNIQMAGSMGILYKSTPPGILEYIKKLASKNTNH